MGGNPAQYQYSTKTIFIDPYRWDSLSPLEKSVVLLHEVAHSKGIRSEILADSFAIKNIQETEYTQKEAVRALIGLLNQKNPEHRKRIEHLKNIEMNGVYQNTTYAESNFFGKKARARRAERKADRHERKKEKISLRGNNRVKVAAAGGGFQKIADTVSSYLTGNKPSQSPDDQASPTESKKIDPVIIAVVVVVVVVVGFVVFKKYRS
jgi:hypothetical protein